MYGSSDFDHSFGLLCFAFVLEFWWTPMDASATKLVTTDLLRWLPAEHNTNNNSQQFIDGTPRGGA